MYWPIGTPRIYAATKFNVGGRIAQPETHAAEGPTLKATESSDGEDSEISNGKVQPRRDENAVSSKGRKASRRPTLLRTTTAAGAQDEEIGGEIVAMKLSRSGHLFATITSSTLSIWQTKVGYSLFFTV
jgi:RAB6A-GEF complex partner protein 1